MCKAFALGHSQCSPNSSWIQLTRLFKKTNITHPGTTQHTMKRRIQYKARPLQCLQRRIRSTLFRRRTKAFEVQIQCSGSEHNLVTIYVGNQNPHLFQSHTRPCRCRPLKRNPKIPKRLRKSAVLGRGHTSNPQ